MACQDLIFAREGPNSWQNRWPYFRDTMLASRHIRYARPSRKIESQDDYVAWMNGLLAFNGIDVDRVITVLQRDHHLLPDLYHATDLGIFPNRVEGGNNMVLMEYLACGKPAIVSYHSGHRDVVHRDNAVLIETHKPLEIHHHHDRSTEIWSDPSLEETIAKLEWCYQNRDALELLAQKAADDMQKFSWRRVAEGLLQAVRRVEKQHNSAATLKLHE